MILTGNEIGKKLIEILDLPPKTTEINIRIAVNEAVIVTCKFFPDLSDQNVQQVEKLFAAYRLEKIDE